VNNNNCLGPNQLVAIAGILSIAIAQRLTPNEIGLAASFFSAFADNLGLISEKLEICMEDQEAENGNDDNGNNASTEDIEKLQAQINQLKCYIKKLENKIDC